MRTRHFQWLCRKLRGFLRLAITLAVCAERGLITNKIYTMNKTLQTDTLSNENGNPVLRMTACYAPLTLGGLFEGIGGFPLAATWAGIKPIWSNEIDNWACRVLRKNFNHRIIEDDIRNIGKQNLEPVDIISGGFPCQPFSVAGNRIEATFLAIVDCLQGLSKANY